MQAARHQHKAPQKRNSWQNFWDKMKRVAAVLLSFLSLAYCAPLDSCDSRVEPKTISNEDVSAQKAS